MTAETRLRAAPPRIITHGCRLNTYESAVMREHAEAAGLTNTVIVNTCAVTSEAVRTARQSIRRARRENPQARILVTGCAVQVDPAMFSAMPEVDVVVGNHEKMQGATFADPALFDPDRRVRVNDIMSLKETGAHIVDSVEGRARAIVHVQNGCDHRCTFCIIPYGRGNSRSVPAGEVVGQIKRLVAAGHSEVVLTGVDLTSWGGDLPGTPPLGNLVARILKLVPDLGCLRLSSIDAIEMDPDLFDIAVSEPRFAPYLHLSLQAGDDMILKRMKRRHSRAQAVDLTGRLKTARPDIAFGADLIAGFPTETEEMFANTLAIIRDCQLSFTHVFPYSPRPGTPAARMPQLDRGLVKDRAARLRAEGEAALARHLARHVGTAGDVLAETERSGRLRDFTQVRLGTGSVPGQTARMVFTGHDGKVLEGAAA